jgi:hypothetical protein
VDRASGDRRRGEIGNVISGNGVFGGDERGERDCGE